VGVGLGGGVGGVGGAVAVSRKVVGVVLGTSATAAPLLVSVMEAKEPLSVPVLVMRSKRVPSGGWKPDDSP
jgi:hypothetical protein